MRVQYVNGKWPDVLTPTRQFRTLKGGRGPNVAWYNYPMWVRLAVPAQAPADTYTGEIELLADLNREPQKPYGNRYRPLRQRIGLTVRVRNFVLPRKTHLETGVFGIWPTHLSAHMQLSRDTPEYRDVVGRICDALAAHRITHGNDSLSPVPHRTADILSPEGRKELLDWCEYWTGKGLGLACVRPGVGEHGQRFWKQYYEIFKQRGLSRSQSPFFHRLSGVVGLGDAGNEVLDAYGPARGHGFVGSDAREDGVGTCAVVGGAPQRVGRRAGAEHVVQQQAVAAAVAAGAGA